MCGIGYVACAWEYENTHGAVCAVGGEVHLKALLDELLNSVTVALYLPLPWATSLRMLGTVLNWRLLASVLIYMARERMDVMASLTAPGSELSGDRMERVTKSSVKPLRALGARLPSRTVVATYLGMGF